VAADCSRPRLRCDPRVLVVLKPGDRSTAVPAAVAPDSHERSSSSAERAARWLWAGSVAVLCPVAGIGAVLSFESLREGATPIFGPLAVGYPLLGDSLILGSTLAYLAGAVAGRGLPGWRWTAHAGVAVTLLLNALAATDLATVPWHITPALVWSILVEMTARQVTIRWKTTPATVPESIPTRLWISSPLQTTQIWLQMARTGERNYQQASARRVRQKATIQIMKAAMPRRSQRRARRLLQAHVRAGTLEGYTVLNLLRHEGHDVALQPFEAVIRALLSQDSHSGESVPPCPHQDTAGTTETTSPRTANGSPSPARPTATEPGGTRRVSEHPRPGHPHDRPDDRRRRQQVAMDIIAERPDIRGRELMQEMGVRGWPLSYKTATRTLALIRQNPGQIR
jgi:hypothetical protein